MVAPYRPLPVSFYARDTVTVARELLGKYLVLDAPEPRIGRISETEAYPGITDRASHSSRGRTERTQPLFGPPGIIYVYMIYGMYYCCNVVTDTPESGGAVLIRAVEPLTGLTGKTSGPGLVCKAYGIDKSFNGQSIVTSRLTVCQLPDESLPLVVALPRVGIDYAGPDKELLYRFRIADPGRLV